MSTAVFLDRDGTIIDEVGYLDRVERLSLYPWSIDAIRAFNRAGFRVVVITNQSGIARGFFTEAVVDDVHRHLAAMLATGGAHVDAYYYCPHHPDGINEYAIECDCRKPEPGLIHRASRELGLSLAGSWFVGDTWMDVAAGRAAGCRTIMVGPEHRTAAELPEDRRPDHAVPDLLAAARIILAAPLAPAPIAVGGAA